MDELIERLNEAWRKLYGDGDEHGVCDTLEEAAAALEAAQGGLRTEDDILDTYVNRAEGATRGARFKPIRLRVIFPDGLVQFVQPGVKPGYFEGLGCVVLPIYTEAHLSAELKAAAYLSQFSESAAAIDQARGKGEQPGETM